MVIGDNDTELASRVILRRTQERLVDWHYRLPGKPQKNGQLDSFNGGLLHDCITKALFVLLARPLGAAALAARLQSCAPK